MVQQGYAYVSQNKGILNLFVAAPNSAAPPRAAGLPTQSDIGVLGSFLR